MRSVLVAALLLAAAPAVAFPAGFSNLNGAPAGFAEQDLARRGFTPTRRYSSRGMEMSEWLSARGDQCLQLAIRGGRTTGVDELPLSRCPGSAQSQANPPGFTPAPGSGDMWADLRGLRARDGDAELKRRGYRQLRRQRDMTLWWHQERDLCITVFQSGGSYARVEQEDPSVCWRR